MQERVRFILQVPGYRKGPLWGVSAGGKEVTGLHFLCVNMGRVRVAGLCFSIDALRREVDTFRQFTADPGWVSDENQEKRDTLVKGLTFVMLNLANDVDQEDAWGLFHSAVDEYHEKCDRLHVAY